MKHEICDACECVSHCLRNGFIPITPVEVPETWPEIDPSLIPESTAEKEAE